MKQKGGSLYEPPSHRLELAPLLPNKSALTSLSSFPELINLYKSRTYLPSKPHLIPRRTTHTFTRNPHRNHLDPQPLSFPHRRTHTSPVNRRRYRILTGVRRSRRNAELSSESFTTRRNFLLPSETTACHLLLRVNLLCLLPHFWIQLNLFLLSKRNANNVDR
uniref:Uncharacterized protein n=1 Tax=Helianthus annuus TaxID=4232 RepID=A0A251VG99_HELAN